MFQRKFLSGKKDGLDTNNNSKDFIFSSLKEFRNSKRLKVWVENFLPQKEYLISKPKFTLFWESIDPQISHYKVQYKDGEEWKDFYFGEKESKEFISEKDFTIYSFKVIAFNKEGEISKEKEIKINFATLPVSFNEIMYNPETSDEYCEYIEIFNNTFSSIDLSGWKLKIKNKELEIKSFEGNSLLLPPQSFALISDDKENIFNSIECNFSIPENVLKLVVKDGNLNLPNKGQGNLTLLDLQGNEIDSITYGNWWGANGDGNSLQKPKPTHYSYLKENWEALSPTPGFQNENFDTLSLNEIDSSFSYKIFSKSDFYIFSKKASPYLIKSSFEIPENKTLFVEPETQIFFDPGTSPNIYGKLVIKGNLKAKAKEGKEILFDSLKDDSFWGGIFFEKGSSGELNYVKISRAGRLTKGTDNTYFFKEGQAIFIREAEVVIENSTIERTKYSAIVIENSNPKFENIKIYSLENIDLQRYSANIFSENSNFEIKNSEILSSPYGIYIEKGNPKIEENLFEENKFPLYIKDSFAFLSENNFKENEINGIVYTGILPQGEIIWENQNFPYVIDKNLTIPKETTLILSPKTILKFNKASDPYNKSSIIVEGKLISQGEKERPIIFTSLLDDLDNLENIEGKILKEYFSDTNSDAKNSSPFPGAWGSVYFKEESEGVLENIILRYGGTGGWSWPGGYEIKKGALEMENGNLSIKNSIFEENIVAGVYFKGGNLNLENTIFRNHNVPFGYSNTSSAGLRIKRDSLLLKDCFFEKNSIDIYQDSGSCQDLLQTLENCENCQFKEGGRFFPSHCF